MSKASPSSRPAVAAPDVVPEGLSEGSSGTPLPAAVVEVNGEEDEEEMEEDELDEDEVEGEGYGECWLGHALRVENGSHSAGGGLGTIGRAAVA